MTQKKTTNNSSDNCSKFVVVAVKPVTIILMCMTHWKMGLLFIASKNDNVSRLATQPHLLHLPPLEPQRQGLAKFDYTSCTIIIIYFIISRNSSGGSSPTSILSSSRRVHLLWKKNTPVTTTTFVVVVVFVIVAAASEKKKSTEI